MMERYFHGRTSLKIRECAGANSLTFSTVGLSEVESDKIQMTDIRKKYHIKFLNASNFASSVGSKGSTGWRRTPFWRRPRPNMTAAVMFLFWRKSVSAIGQYHKNMTWNLILLPNGTGLVCSRG
jgi:hypothetical protein